MKLTYARPILAGMSISYCFILLMTDRVVPDPLWALAALSYGWFALDRTLTHRLGDREHNP